MSVNNYTISRVNSTLYLVKTKHEIVKECNTYKEAEDYIFNKQSEELLHGFTETRQAS